MQPLILYNEANGITPNPYKVKLLLESLELPYETSVVEFADIKGPAYEAVNVNARLPTLKDPNNGDFIIWESGAIMEYLVANYDKEHKLSYPESDFANYWHSKQWLHFQMSGQGPYFGQKAWFTRYHKEDVPSAKERYANEIRRVWSVVEKHLSKTGQQYLVGNKCTYVDLAFVPWFAMPGLLDDQGGMKWEDVPKAKEWLDRVTSRPVVKKMEEEKMETVARVYGMKK